MEKYYILEWPESQKWIDLWYEKEIDGIMFLEDEKVAVECELYDKAESDNNESEEAPTPLKKFLVSFTLSMDYDIEVEAKDEDDAERIASEQLPSLESGEWCNGGAECWNVQEIV